MYCQDPRLLAVGGCGIPVVVLTLVGNRSFGCHGEEIDSRADNALCPVGNEIRVQAWDKAAPPPAVYGIFLRIPCYL